MLQKGSDKLKKLISICILLIVFLGILISFYNVFIFFYNRKENKSVVIDKLDDIENESKISNPIDFSKYSNQDVKGFISIKGLDINYPILQTNDNKFYLDHDINKEYSSHGSIFFDCKANLNDLTTYQNIFVYGHHMKDKTMFANLSKYMNIDNFLRNNEIYVFLKELNVCLILNVFSVYSTTDNEMHEMFFIDEKNKKEYIEKALEKGKNTNKIVDCENSIMTFYTCSYEEKEARYFIHTTIREIKHYEN